MRFVLLCLLCAKLISCGQKSPARAEQKLPQQEDWSGKKFPDFSATDISGKRYEAIDMFGKLVVVNFWFTACKPCVAEMPELNQLVRKYAADTSIVFLALTFDREKQVKEFLKTRPFEYRILPVGENFISQTLGLRIFPTHWVVDRNGIVRYSAFGYDDGGGNQSSSIDLLTKAIEKWRSS